MKKKFGQFRPTFGPNWLKKDFSEKYEVGDINCYKKVGK